MPHRFRRDRRGLGKIAERCSPLLEASKDRSDKASPQNVAQRLPKCKPGPTSLTRVGTHLEQLE
ncbi:hypothetical protein RISK_002237 [Rhodopirellula islandica]|uniref:Uncharacterized protein n=1 Tax=Rhodopirellula islandica TaxID=595434 RepID=A0A0J1BGD3_RHOIS|nr:hypothetical protein RISK_002237 [Rhodopirellula islandica]